MTAGKTAFRIEPLVYGLARTHRFSLLCGYALRDANVSERDRQIAWRGAAHPRAKRLHGRVALADPSAVTMRERDVLRRAALGHANKDIANALDISVRTVEAHKANAMRKLGFAERADVVRFAVAQGWLRDG